MDPLYRIQLSSDDDVYLDITDKPTLREIAAQMKATGNEQPTVEYLADEQKLALTFGEGARVDVDVSGIGKLLLPATEKDSQTFLEAKVVLEPYRYEPGEPPPPDSLC